MNPDLCAAKIVSDRVYQVPSYTDESYMDALLEVCLKEKVSFIIPLYEPELPIMARFRTIFAQKGIRIIVSDQLAIDTCLDKFKLSQHFKAHKILTPKTYIPSGNLKLQAGKWVIKPRVGMGSKNVRIVDNDVVHDSLKHVMKPIIQQYIKGQEYSIDAYVGLDGEVLSVVPRKRLEVRSGEVSKSVTCFDKVLIQQSLQVIKGLPFFGPITIQGIKERETDEFYFIEINPRFGGGVPLTIKAGIPYADFVGNPSGKYRELYPFTSNLLMIRYDEAIYELMN